MPDYSKGKIYCIRSPHSDEVYIGSTISPYLSKRMGQHREKYRKWKKGEQRYITSFKLLDLGDAYIELVEDYPCETKQQLERREGEVMRSTPLCVNQKMVGRTRHEYYVENKIKVKEYKEKNKDKIREQKKAYNESNKDKIREQKKAYREKNKDKIKIYNKEYRLNKK